MIDREQIFLWWQLIQRNGEKFCEIRCLDGQRTYSGYYKNIDNLIRDVEPLSERPNLQIYFVLNTIKSDCYDRMQQERMVEKPKNTTTDNDIEGRDFILLDFDTERPSGVGSTDDQLKAAHDVAKQVYTYLTNAGIANIVVCKSGNGVHALIPVRLANTPENTKLVERFLKAISMLFSTETVHIDTKVGNAARICKLYGTFAKKGANTKEHPWRLAKFWKVPEIITPNNKEYIEKIANLYPDEQPQPTRENNYGQSKFDVVEFLNKHNIEYRTVRISGGTRYILKKCPFNESHHDPDSMVFQHDNGALSFTCYHNSCSQYGWREFRLLYEPDAYDKKDYREFQQKQRYYAKYTEPVEIKDENPEDGKKWLSFDDIQTVRDEELIAIPTGILKLDKLIKGLILGETTLLSGINASGKTLFLNTLALNAVQKGFNVALWSGELQSFRLKSWIAQTAAGKMNVSKIEGSEYAYEANSDVLPKIGQWLNGKLFIYNNNYGSVYEQLIKDVSDCIDQNKTRFIILDNLMAISLDNKVGDKNEKQKQLILELSDLAKKKNVHILLVAHPRKEANFTLLRKESISGTSDLTNVVQNLLLIHRVGQDFEKRATEFLGKERVNQLLVEDYSNIIEIAKNRSYGVMDQMVGMYYEIETRRFKNSKAEQVHYEWDEPYETYRPLEQAPIPVNYSFDAPMQETDDRVGYFSSDYEDFNNLPF